MVELKVLTLIVTGMGSPSFLVLQPIEEHASEGKSRVVPICVGPNEALTWAPCWKGRVSRGR